MSRRKASVLVLFMIGLFFFSIQIPLQASIRLDLKLRVYEGVREGALKPSKFVTTSYLQPTISANLLTAFDLEEEKNQVKRVFNLQDINLLTESNMTIGESGQSAHTARHYFRLNGNAFAFYAMLQEWKGSGRFLVLLNEMIEEKPKNVLTTEIILMGGHSAVFGFEDRSGKPYFCSFHITGPPERVLPPPPPPPPAPSPSHPPSPPPPPKMKKELEEFEKGALKARDTIDPPAIIKMVDPVYPKEAEEKGLKGFVVLNVRTDTEGNVKMVMVLKSSDEIFDQAAIDAVKQWKYEPFYLEGKPRELVFSVSLKFEK
jgi:TonB family protein